ncbi:MAG: hypothetical protein LBU32_15680 [Clostridiales bacterium]|jgi:hypothetical protein|nr:hypothetical protein [Clostridiales bacterium]
MLRTSTYLSIPKKLKKPILFSFDAAAYAEAKPSRQARRPIQGTAYVFTRLEEKAARGRQAAAGTAGCGSIALNCEIQRYNKDLGIEGSKIKCASDMAPPPPEPEGKACFMAGGWQPRAGTADSRLKNGWRRIGALRADRAAFPGGMKIPPANSQKPPTCRISAS